MALLLALLLACGALYDEERCVQASAGAEEAWEKVAGFYERTADLMETERADATANVASAASLRRGASASAAAAHRRSQSGIRDLRTGTSYKDPSVAQRQRGQARSANARAAQHQERALLYLIDLVEVSDRIEARRAKASLAHALGTQDPLAPLAQWQGAQLLTDTELAERARLATRDAQLACADRPTP
ncbi:MAG: hypothetical protein H6741_35495 [Alphaproteobacteria bacterium]|nr:hypothetical protein [Alphaproteobacteria bacterium]MCB9798013.1 hypothetical protein [Alphaproteobacteria bacterium]